MVLASWLRRSRKPREQRQLLFQLAALVGPRVRGVGPHAQVVDDGHVAEQAAAFGNERDAGGHDPVRRVVLDCAALEQDAAAGMRPHQAGDGLEQRRLACAVGTEDNGGPSGLDLERDVVQRLVLAVGDADVLKPQHRRLRDRRASHAASDSTPSRRAFRDPLAGIHHHHSVAQGADGFHDVLDHDDGDAVATDQADQVDAGLQLGGIEAGEPLVEQQQLRMAGERARKLEPLLVDVGQLEPSMVRVPAEPDALQQRLGFVRRRGRVVPARCRTCGRA